MSGQVLRFASKDPRRGSICLLRALCYAQFKFGVKSAIKALTEARQFYDTIESVYNFFEHSIVRWQKLQNVHDRSCSNPTLKALNSTRWSGRYDAVYASKERFCDVMKCLTHKTLISTKVKKKR